METRKMRFRKVLFPLIRLCQCSGLCPLSVYGSGTNSTLGSKKTRFAILTAAICIAQLLICIHTFANSGNLADPSHTSVLVYTNLIVALSVRVHAVVVLVESYVKRSIQLELLEKIDEIDTIFNEKLKTKSNDDRLRRRFRQFIIIWIVRLGVFESIVLLGGIFTYNWPLLYSVMTTFPPLYIGSLFYVRLMVYLDVVRYNIETINGCLAKLRESSLNWIWLDRQPVSETETDDIWQQLIYLRICYFKTWEASALINRSVRWSLLIGVNNEFLLLVVNSYWLFFLLFQNSAATRISLLLIVLWIGFNMPHLLELSMICERILEQVRIRMVGDMSIGKTRLLISNVL